MPQNGYKVRFTFEFPVKGFIDLPLNHAVPSVLANGRIQFAKYLLEVIVPKLLEAEKTEDEYIRRRRYTNAVITYDNTLMHEVTTHFG